MIVVKFRLIKLILHIKLVKTHLLFVGRKKRSSLRIQLIGLNLNLAKHAVPYYVYSAKRKVKEVASVLC